MTLSVLLSSNNHLKWSSLMRSTRSTCNFVRHFRTLPHKQKCMFLIYHERVPNFIVKKCFSRNAVNFSSSKGRGVTLDKAAVNRLFTLAKPEKWKIAGAICLLLVSSSITMAVPFALGKMIDVIYSTETEKMKENLYTMSKVLFTVFVIGAVCNFGRVYLISVAGQRITKDLRHKLFSSILNQEVAFFDKSKAGELVNRLSADTYLVSQTLTSNVSDGLRSTITIITGVSMMVYMSPSLAAIGIATVAPVAGIAVYYGRFIRKLTKNVQTSLANATALAQEKISNVRTVRVFSKEIREVQAYDDKLKDILRLFYKEALARGVFFGFAGFSGNMIILSVLYYGGTLVSTGSLTVGDLSSFLMYAAYIGVSISGMSSFYSELNKGLGASVRLWEIVDRVPTIQSLGTIYPKTDPIGFVKFENVTFAYPTRKETPILQNLTLDIPNSSITAIVGPSGGGKSTIPSLLLRLYDPDAGKVLLDGTEIRQLTPGWLRSHVGFVTQEPVLFSCSIKDNILYGSSNPDAVSMEQITEVAKEANCLDFIKNFPAGFDTTVGERGVMLSGGQKQRIAIARALIKNPRILILDEATSALDSESEHLVQESFERIMKGRTVLTIAHRLSTIKNADRIAVLEGGRIVEIGTYDELIALENGFFKRLVKHQAFL